MKTIAEQITALENKRAASATRMEAVMQKSLDEDRTTKADEQESFDTLQGEVEAIDKDLVRLPKGSELIMRWIYDNSESNPRQPSFIRIIPGFPLPAVSGGTVLCVRGSLY